MRVGASGAQVAAAAPRSFGACSIFRRFEAENADIKIVDIFKPDQTITSDVQAALAARRPVDIATSPAATSTSCRATPPQCRSIRTPARPRSSTIIFHNFSMSAAAATKSSRCPTRSARRCSITTRTSSAKPASTPKRRRRRGRGHCRRHDHPGQDRRRRRRPSRRRQQGLRDDADGHERRRHLSERRGRQADVRQRGRNCRPSALAGSGDQAQGAAARQRCAMDRRFPWRPACDVRHLERRPAADGAAVARKVRTRCGELSAVSRPQCAEGAEFGRDLHALRAGGATA